MHLYCTFCSPWNALCVVLQKTNQDDLISAFSVTVCTNTHTHAHDAHRRKRITLFNLERPSAQLTERVRQKESDWERWGRCKVINNLLLKSNKRLEFTWAACILTDRPCLLRCDIIIIPWKTKLKYEDGRIVYCVCVPWYSNTLQTAVRSIQLFVFSPAGF